jgi:MOSC domain-containing protein YiiM
MMPARRSPLFSWLNRWRPEELCGTLVAIFVADAAGAPMRSLESAQCLRGRGIEGDRYAAGRGHWMKTDGCEVTLVRREDIEQAHRRAAVGFLDGGHRRNLVVEGIPLQAYHRRRVRIGGALLEFHRLRPPCGYLDRLLQPGAAKALGSAAGIGLRVVEDGMIRIGDRVEVLSGDS